VILCYKLPLDCNLPPLLTLAFNVIGGTVRVFFFTNHKYIVLMLECVVHQYYLQLVVVGDIYRSSMHRGCVVVSHATLEFRGVPVKRVHFASIHVRHHPAAPFVPIPAVVDVSTLATLRHHNDGSDTSYYKTETTLLLHRVILAGSCRLREPVQESVPRGEKGEASFHQRGEHHPNDDPDANSSNGKNDIILLQKWTVRSSSSTTSAATRRRRIKDDDNDLGVGASSTFDRVVVGYNQKANDPK
jgi:hypothetical protein